MASLLCSNIQDFVGGCSGQMAPPSSLRPDFKVLGGGKGEVKPPKCPTRHPRVGGFCFIFIII